MDFESLFEIAIERSNAQWDQEETEREALWDTLSSLSDLSDVPDSEDDSDTDREPQLASIVQGCAEPGTEDVKAKLEGFGMDGSSMKDGVIEAGENVSLNGVGSPGRGVTSDDHGSFSRGDMMDVDAEVVEVADEGVAPRTGEKRGRDESSCPGNDGPDAGLTERQQKKKRKEKQRKKQKKVANGEAVRGPKSESRKKRVKENRKQERTKRKAAGLPRKYSEATKERRRHKKAFKRALKHWVGTLGPDGYRASAASELKWGETIDIPTEYDASKLSKAKGAYVGVNRPVDEDGIDDDFTVEKAKKMGAKYIAWDGV